MDKNQFLGYLKAKGYKASLEEGIVMVLDQPFDKISELAKKKGYKASWGVRWTKKQEPVHKVECYEQMSLF